MADPQQHEKVAQAEVDRLGTLLPGYRQAADDAGNKLADAIAAHREEWAAALEKTAGELADAYDVALAEARLAVAAFVPAQAGLNWVGNFHAGKAKSGRYSSSAAGESESADAASAFRSSAVSTTPLRFYSAPRLERRAG